MEAGNGTTSYHLSVLQDNGFIKSEKSRFDFRRYYFEKGVKFPYKFQSKLSFVELEILGVLQSKGRMTVGEIAEAVDKVVQTVSYNIKKLEKEDFVRTQREGREKICVITKRGERYLGKQLLDKNHSER